jgi:hypothetical protein
MKVYNLRLILGGLSQITDEVEDALFDAGCDDGHLGMIDRVGLMEFDREAGSFIEALCSAIANIEEAGYRVVRVEPEDLVTAAEIARRSGRTRASVSSLISGERGPGTFPPPVSNVDAKSPLWRWSEVARWLSEYEGGAPDVAEQAEDLAFVNDLLSLRSKFGDDATLRDVVRRLQLPDSEPVRRLKTAIVA